MKEIKLASENIQKLLEKKINVLIAEDDPMDMKAISAVICSPLYKITAISNLDETQKALTTSKWSCWIIDIELGTESGLDFLISQQNFHFKIVFSGLGLMQTAFKATQNGGALAVFDKGTPELTEKDCYTIDKIACLGFLLKGNCPEHLKIFRTLVYSEIKSAGEWANSCSIVRRRLEQICSEYSHLSPLQFITAYRAISHLLGETGIDQGRHQYLEKTDFEFSQNCLIQFNSQWEKIYSPILKY